MRFWKPMLTVLLLSVASASAQAPDPMDAAPFTSAMVCGHCPVDIHAAWTTNLPSRAATEPIFTQALEEAVGGRGEDVRKFCLTFHAPTTVATKDYAMTRNITKESVTCDFCHTMVEANPGAEVPYRLAGGGPGNIKAGPYKDADPKEHGGAFSGLPPSPRLWARCHEHKQP